jgi:hypothetical protein
MIRGAPRGGSHHRHLKKNGANFPEIFHLARRRGALRGASTTGVASTQARHFRQYDIRRNPRSVAAFFSYLEVADAPRPEHRTIAHIAPT